MNTTTPTERLGELKSEHPNLAAPVRLLVAAGECGVAAGAEQIIQALEAAVNQSGQQIPVVRTGCDGQCSGAVQVVLQRNAEPDWVWWQVTPDTCQQIVNLATGSISNPETPPAFIRSAEPIDGYVTLANMPHYDHQRRWLTGAMGSGDPVAIEEALSNGRYGGLASALTMSPEEIIDEVGNAELAGRGGAYFPTAIKWRSCREWLNTGEPSYLIINAEEGEPGVFKDRHLIEGDPHLVIEGALIAAYALGCEHIFFYLNGEARVTRTFLSAAIDAATSTGLIGASILGTDFSCTIEIRDGGGGYVLGEGTVLIESIDGQRSMPRLRPPHSHEWGLWDRPTVVQNVETLANVPLIVDHGSDWFSELGVPGGRGTKLICLSGDVRRKGMYEIEIGTTLETVINAIGGGPPAGRSLQAILTGGPSGNLVSPDLLNSELVPRSEDVLLGSGNISAIGDGHDLFELVQRLTRYNADESCGKCTPCREGVPRMCDILDELADGSGTPQRLEDLQLLCDTAAAASICGLGQMAPNPILSAMKHFDLPQFAVSEGD